MTHGSTQTHAGQHYLTETEEKQLFGFLVRLKDRQAERDLVLLKLLRLLGLRRVEAIRLNVGDVYGRTRLTIDARIAAKGAIGELDLPVELQRLLEGFYRRKRAWGEPMGDTDPLFVSRTGRRLSIRAVNDLVTKWGEQAGLAPRLTPHWFRHTKAQRIVHDERYLSPEARRRALQFANRQLRHRSMSSTLVYTAPNREEMAVVAGI